MKRIAKFHKVSLEQFMEGWKDTFGEQYTEDQIKALYEDQIAEACNGRKCRI